MTIDVSKLLMILAGLFIQSGGCLSLTGCSTPEQDFETAMNNRASWVQTVKDAGLEGDFSVSGGPARAFTDVGAGISGVQWDANIQARPNDATEKDWMQLVREANEQNRMMMQVLLADRGLLKDNQFDPAEVQKLIEAGIPEEYIKANLTPAGIKALGPLLIQVANQNKKPATTQPTEAIDDETSDSHPD